MTCDHDEVIRRELAFAKAATSVSELWQRNLALSGGGCLVPLSRLHLDDVELIRQLGEWREAHVAAYPTRFPISPERTRRWLETAVLGNPLRILFLVFDKAGRLVGHLGLANGLARPGWLEIDNVLRGKPEGERGVMTQAIHALTEWARTVLFTDGFYLRVLESNTRAIAFYHALGYQDCERSPLRWHHDGNESQLVPAGSQPAADAYITMEGRCAPHDPQRMILTAGPSIGLREQVYVGDAVRTGWNSNWSHYLDRFEHAIAETVGVRYALATSSCTGALHIALAALGIGPGDEVIVPETTWVATANAVRYAGATPVFADVDPATWLLDPQGLEAWITPRTRAIIPVHLYGFPCDMTALMAVARRHGLRVIEDAAPSLGARHAGQMTGSFGDFSAFSFQGAKLAVSGEGGVLLTDDPELYAKARKIWDQGRASGTFWIDADGLKYKMSNVQAALALAQVERIEEMVAAKRRIYSWYKARLGALADASLYAEPPDSYGAYWMNSLRLGPGARLDRDTLMARLKARHVDTRAVFPAISQYPIWPRRQAVGPVAKAIGETALNLPSGVCLTRNEVDHACDQILALLS